MHWSLLLPDIIFQTNFRLDESCVISSSTIGCNECGYIRGYPHLFLLLMQMQINIKILKRCGDGFKYIFKTQVWVQISSYWWSFTFVKPKQAVFLIRIRIFAYVKTRVGGYEISAFEGIFSYTDIDIWILWFCILYIEVEKFF